MAILCTTDGSIRSLRALPHAARIASVTGEELALLRVLEPKGPSAEHCERELADNLDAANVDGRTIVEARRSGESVADVICRVAREIGARLIASDTRGSGVIRHALIGSVAVEVLEESPVPLLMTGAQAVDPTASSETYRLALATDGGYESYGRLGKLREAMALPNVEPLLVGISIPVLHEADNALEELTRHCQQVATTISPVQPMEVVTSRATGFEKLEAAIVRVATEAGADAIGMVSASTSRKRHIFMGSVSLATLNRSPVPIILMRADD